MLYVIVFENCFNLTSYMNYLYFYILAFCSVFFYAVDNILAKKMTDIPPFLFMTGTMFVLFLCSLIAFFFVEYSNTKVLASKQVVFLIVFGIINFISFWLYLYAIKKIPISHYLVIFALTPIMTGLFWWIYGTEKLWWNFFFGAIIVGIGIAIALIQ